jgi:hypothetical protein
VSFSAHDWLEIVIQGLHDLFCLSRTQEQERIAIEAFEEIKKLCLEVIR